ncbi:MAG TPA: hypothetical protein VEZ46_07345 [Mycobacteriales bacterium]|jgi:hypothetical protein|nr:hypothetical protein [Mycobacteriales bacterium]
MDSGALLNPRGPLPPSVYWRRRLVLLGATVAILALVFAAYSCGNGDGTAGGAPTGTPRASTTKTAGGGTVQATAKATAARSPSAVASAKQKPTPSPSAKSPSPSAKRAAACRDADLEVEAKPDKLSYPSGALPVLTLSVTNAGPAACSRDLGQTARELRLTSGPARVWSSDDCADKAPAEQVVLKPGETRDFSVTWSRRRSAEGCPADQPIADPGTYRVTGRVGSVTSPAKAFLLN